MKPICVPKTSQKKSKGEKLGIPRWKPRVRWCSNIGLGTRQNPCAAGEKGDEECESAQTGVFLDKEDSWEQYFEGWKETKVEQSKDLSPRNVYAKAEPDVEDGSFLRTPALESHRPKVKSWFSVPSWHWVMWSL